MAQQIGEITKPKPEAATVSSMPALTQPWAGTAPAILSDEQLTKLAAIARQPSPKSQPVGLDEFGKILGTLAAALPRRASDDLTGKAMLAIYHRMLGKYPRQAIAHMAEQALEHCRWFPTIAECREFLKAWDEQNRDSGDNHTARRQIQDEMQARLDRDMDRLKARAVTQAEVDAWPPRWRQIGATRGYLDADGILRFPA